MSDSVQSQRQQLTRLPRPWDPSSKNTGVGCHFFLQCMKVKSESEVAQSCPTLSDPMDCSLPSSSIHGIFQARVLGWDAIAFSDKNIDIPEKYLVMLHWLYSFDYGHRRKTSSYASLIVLLWLCGSQQTGKFWKRWEYQITLFASWEICIQVKMQWLE